MDMQKSRRGFYTLTFLDREKTPESDIFRKFNAIGKVHSIDRLENRIFINFGYKDDAIKVLKAFEKTLNLQVAKSSSKGKRSGESEEGRRNDDNEYLFTPSQNKTENIDDKKSNSFTIYIGNLPKNYTDTDVENLVLETNPTFIGNINESMVCKVKFCKVELDSYENMTYLVNKLHGFTISGEKLIVMEKEKLLTHLRV